MNYNTLQQPITPKLSGDLFINFTSQYLLPQVTLFSEETLDMLNDTKWLAFGIADRKYPKYTEYDNKLFCLASTERNMQYWLDNKEYYLYEDGEANKVMVILELPINNRNAFLSGDYSQLYEPDVRDELISEYRVTNKIQYPNHVYGIITKKDEEREAFEKKRNKDFNLDPPLPVTSEMEYEYPPVMIREIFNYNYTKDDMVQSNELYV